MTFESEESATNAVREQFVNLLGKQVCVVYKWADICSYVLIDVFSWVKILTKKNFFTALNFTIQFSGIMHMSVVFAHAIYILRLCIE